MANTSNVRLLYFMESAFGTLPTGTDTLSVLRFTTESLKPTDSAQKSPELRSDRLNKGYDRLTFGTGGDLNFVLSYSTYDDFFRSLMMDSAWGAVQTNTGTFTVSTGNVTGTGCGTNIVRHDIVRWTEPDASVVSWHRVTAKANDNDITLTPAPADVTGDGDEEVELGERLEIGSTVSSIYFEREYTDNASTFQQLTGNVPNSLRLSMTPEGRIEGTWSFQGKTMSSASAAAGDGSPTAATTTSVMTAENDVEAIWENNVVTGVRSFSFTFTNNLIKQGQLGSLGPVGFALGEVDITGEIEVDFDDNTHVDKFLDQTDTAFVVVLKDSAGNSYVFDFPAVRVLDADTTASGGPGTEIVAKLQFGGKAIAQGTSGSTTDRMFRIYRFAA